MIQNEYPEEGELVVGTIAKVQNFGAFVALDEYPEKEGFIHISEIATGWVKRIRNHVREKQKVVCKVLRVEAAKNHIDLSLKRVNEHQRRDKIQEWKNSQKAHKLLEMVAHRLKEPVETCYTKFGNELTKKYGTLYSAFEECAYDCDILKNDGFKGPWLEHFEVVAQESITIPFVTIKGLLTISTWAPNGINHIREALQLAQQSEYEDVTILIKYIGAPRYMISVKAPDYKIAEDQMKKAVTRITDSIHQHNGQCEFKRELED